jgi:hypothetical protein
MASLSRKGDPALSIPARGAQRPDQPSHVVAGQTETDRNPEESVYEKTGQKECLEEANCALYAP